MSIGHFGRVSTRGLLLLTNYRLIFISIARLYADAYSVWKEFNKFDLSTQIPIASIVSCHLTSETDSNSGHNTEIIKIKTADMRELSFYFREETELSYSSFGAQAVGHLKRASQGTSFNIDTTLLKEVASGITSRISEVGGGLSSHLSITLPHLLQQPRVHSLPHTTPNHSIPSSSSSSSLSSIPPDLIRRGSGYSTGLKYAWERLNQELTQNLEVSMYCFLLFKKTYFSLMFNHYYYFLN